MKTIFDRIVYLLAGAALALIGFALVDFLLHPLAPDYTFHSTLYRAVVMLVLVPLNLLAGFLIIRRVPGNVVGPLLIVWSGTVAFFSVREGIGLVPFALFYYYDLAYGWFAFFLMVLHFPNGKIYPPGAARWMYSLFGVLAVLTNLIFLSTAIFTEPAQVANPFYLPALETQADLILGLGLIFLVLLMVLVLVTPVLRYRKGSYQERQQIKWLALFVGFIIPYFILGLIVYPLLTGGEAMELGDSLVAVFTYIITGLVPPVAIGVAVLRYRLWDIDILIRRTLLYSMLTIVLTLVYFGSVVVMQALLTALIGHQSQAAIVLSTLGIVVLFTPLRRRIQSFIDRRFYRQKYNADKVLAAFSSVLREEMDLDHLTSSILKVVEETMPPEHVSLWLREVDHQPGRQRSEQNPSQISS